MAEQISTMLRDALERLDQAIDRLESRVATAAPEPVKSKAADSAVAERLDRVIERIELALAG